MSASQPLFEIHDPEINVEEIMARIRQRIEERRAQASTQGLDYDHLVDSSGKDGSSPTSADLLYDVEQLRENSESIWATVDVRNRRLPLVNALAFRMEKLLHRLVVKYVNILAGRQTAFNRAVADVTYDLVQAHAASQAQLESLEKEVAKLTERITELERAQGKRD